SAYAPSVRDRFHHRTDREYRRCKPAGSTIAQLLDRSSLRRYGGAPLSDMNNEQQPGRVSSRAISGLPGPQGPQGLEGPAGPPGPGFTDVILRSHTETLENTTALSANVFCEPGEIALGGGASAAGPGNATLRRSQPIFVGTTATGWD